MSTDDRSSLGRLTREIVESLGIDIVNGRYKPGENLPTEAELSRELGASRSVTRESVKILNAKGLVTARPRLGTSVMPATNWNLFDPDVLNWILRGRFSLPLLIEFTEVRRGIEPRAAALAAIHATASQKQAIQAGYERMVAALNGADDPLASDIAFHLAILDASNNRFLARMKPMVSAALSFSIRYTDRIKRDERSKVRRHGRVCEAIMAGDPDRATEAVDALLLEALDLMENRSGAIAKSGAREKKP